MQRELDIALAAERAAEQTLGSLRAVAVHAGGLESADGDADEAGQAGPTRVLAGAELREAITRVALRRNAHGQEVHWRMWFDWLHAAGLGAAGKSAEATFQTQLARSPLVRRASRDGVYVLDVGLLEVRREDVQLLHRRLAELPPPDQLALMGDVREQRRALGKEIARAERSLEEAWRLLSEEIGEGWSQERPPDARHLTRLWEDRSEM